ncbi:MAG: GGDEF domain-containing protein [Saccharospirillum sp.]
MNEQQEWLRRGVLDLSIMLRGLDAELNDALDALKETLKDRTQVDVETFRNALERTDTRFDQLEPIAEQSIQQLHQLYRALTELNGTAATRALQITLEKPSNFLFDQLAMLDDALRSLPASLPDGDDATLIRLRQRLCSRFITLLRTLAILGDDDGSLRSLAQKLEPIPDWSTLDTLAAETISLIQKRLDKEKGQFEYYLNKLNDQLKQINELILNDHNSVSELNDLNRQLDQNVNAHLDRARQELSEAVSIDQLQQTLDVSLEALSDVIVSFKSQTDARLEAMQANQQQLNEQLNTLQANNLKLIKQVALEREMSARDPLTQLPNRQGFDQRLKEELMRSIRYRQPLSIALIDIDFFKRINDEFGHLAGDKVLKILAKEMKSQVRQSDYLARFGGEEFVLILPQTDAIQAELALENMRLHISQCPFNFQGNPVQITISTGIAQHDGEEPSDLMVHRADKALYQSKEAGRNRTTRS